MPPITTEGPNPTPLIAESPSSTPLIASLIIVPLTIVFAGTAVAICCSEKWNKSDNRLKRLLRQRRAAKRSSTQEQNTEDSTKSEGPVSLLPAIPAPSAPPTLVASLESTCTAARSTSRPVTSTTADSEQSSHDEQSSESRSDPETVICSRS